MPYTRAAPRQTRRELALYGGVAAALAVAVFARLHMLGSLPAELLGADRFFVQAAVRVTEQGWIGLRSVLALGQPTGLAYVMAAWISLFGDAVLSVRLFAASLGLATVGMFYLHCRQMFGQRAAVLGGLLLAFGVWHLSFSRLALPVNLLVLLEIVTLYLLYRAFAQWRDGERGRWTLVLAGVSFGAAAYTHNAFFIFAAAVLLLWLREYLAAEYGARAVTRLAVAFFVPALLVASPYLVALAADAGGAGDRLRDVSVTSTAEYQSLSGVTEQTRHVLASIGGAAAAVLFRRDAASGEGGLSGRLLDPATAFLALVGLAVGMWRWRQRNHAYVWLLFATAVVVAGIASGAGMSGRLLVALPAVFAAAGFGLHWLLTWLRGRVPEAAAYGLVALVIAFVAFHNLSAFFDETTGPPPLRDIGRIQPTTAGVGPFE